MTERNVRDGDTTAERYYGSAEIKDKAAKAKLDAKAVEKRN